MIYLEKKKLKTYAAMVKDEEDIKKNSMKLYSYLLCIAGKEPNGTGRLFQQKNLVLTEIKKCTGLDPKTIKVYLYELEMAGLVKFKGKEQFKRFYSEDFLKENKSGDLIIDRTALRKAKESEAFSVWKMRDKKAYYHIPRPERFTPIPEITLEKLNSVYELDELELKIYIMCCTYRDIQVELYNGVDKKISFEQLRDSLGLKDNGSTINRKIKKTFYFLRGLGLMDFEMGSYYNSRGNKIECFNLKQVNYYVNEERYEWNEDDIVDSEFLKEAKERLKQYDYLFSNSNNDKE